MTILALDTAGPACGACIFDPDSGRVLALSDQEIGKGHAEKLMQVIDAVLREAGANYASLSRIVTTIGPGSFTGIRVGVATARGFGLGLGIPVIGVTTLEAILEHAMQVAGFADSDPVGAILDAGRGEAYCQFNFETEFAAAATPFMVRVEDIAASPEIRRLKPALCGNGSGLPGTLSGIAFRELDHAAFAPIGTVARLGAGKTPDGTRPEPLYLRKPDAKAQAGFTLARA